LLTSRSSDSCESATDPEWGEGDRRERHNDKERGGSGRWEDDMRERDETQRGGEEVGGGGRWRGGGEPSGEGGGAKQERKEHEKKGERWEEGKERWTLYGGKVAILIWIRFAFSRGLGSTYVGGHDNFAVGPTRDKVLPSP